MAVPTDVGVTVWYQASAGDTQDHSGNGYHPTGASNLPSIDSADGSAAFVHSNKWFRVPDAALSGAAAVEGFVVVKHAAFSDPLFADSGLWSVQSAGFSTHYIYPPDSHLYEGFGSTTRQDCGALSAATLTGAYRVYTVRSKNGLFEVRLDGTVLYTSASNTFGVTTPFQVGRSKDPSYALAGRVKEWALWAGADVLSSGDRSAMDAYFASIATGGGGAGSQQGGITLAGQLWPRFG